MATIGMVLEKAFPPDIRVEKEATTLARAGHDVHVLALAFGDDTPVTMHGATHVHQIQIDRWLHNKLHPTLVRLPIYRAMWRRWIRRFVARVAPDVLTVHDLPLAAPGLDVAEVCAVPVILDLHENFPAAIESWGFDRGVLGRYFYDLEAWRAYERDAARRAAAVIVVVDEALERFTGGEVASSDTAVVMNTESASFGADAHPADPGEAAPLRLLYIGGFGPHRGIDTSMRAIAALEPAPGATLRVVGTGRTRAELERLRRDLALESRVSIERWVPAERVPEVIASCHVGLVPHVKSAHTESTVPHKLFQYMRLGRPVLVSDCAPLKRIVEGTGSGLVFRSGDAEDMARAITELADPARRRELGARGREAASTHLSWERDAERLCELYARVLARVPARGESRA